MREQQYDKKEQKINQEGVVSHYYPEQITQINKKVNIKSLKEFVSVNFPSSSHLRHLILSEKRYQTKSEFLTKIPVWLALFDLERNR